MVMKVFSQVSTIPGGPAKLKLVLCCSYKRTAAQYLAISLLSPKTLPSVTKPPGVGQVSHRQCASGLRVVWSYIQGQLRATRVRLN